MDVVVAVQYKIINEVVKPSGSSYKEGLHPSYGSINPTLDQSLVSEDGSSSNPTRNPTLDEQHGVWRAYYKLTGVNSQFRAYIEDVVRYAQNLSDACNFAHSRLASAAALRSRARHWTRSSK